MIGVVAQITVKEGAQADFEAVARRLVEAVKANEPGCKFYDLFKVRDGDTEYMFMELFNDQAAVDAHRASEHYRTIGREMGPFLDGAPRVTRTDRVG